MRPDAPRLSHDLDRIARAALAQGQGDPVERMADHAEAAMAEAWNQALAQAMQPPALAPQATPEPQAPSSPGPQYGAQGPIRPFQGSASPLPTTRIPDPAPPPVGLSALPSGAGMPPGGWPLGLFPPGVSPYGALPPGLGATWGLGQAPVLEGLGAKPGGARPGLSPELQAMIETKAAVHGLPAWLVKNVVLAESGGNPKATSPVGAQGLMQLMPETARELGVDNPYDAEDNLDGGVRYLKRMLDAFGGDLPKAVAAYNAGPGAVARHGGVPPYAETQAYVRRVLGS